MLDLICRRYPNRRPSDYLEIDDPFIAIQLDYSLAAKFHREEFKYDENKTEATHEILKGIGAGVGVEWQKKSKPRSDKVADEPIPIDVALAMFGGKGVHLKK